MASDGPCALAKVKVDPHLPVPRCVISHALPQTAAYIHSSPPVLGLHAILPGLAYATSTHKASVFLHVFGRGAPPQPRAPIAALLSGCPPGSTIAQATIQQRQQTWWARADAVSAVAGLLPGARGSSGGGLQCRGCDDFAARRPSASVVALILEGKIAQATLLAWRAYEDEEAFRRATGLEHARLLTHAQLDTQVCRCAALASPHAQPCTYRTSSARCGTWHLEQRADPVSEE